jgi:hypothetical protein
MGRGVWFIFCFLYFSMWNKQNINKQTNKQNEKLKNKKGFCFVFVYAVAFYITENRLRVQRNDGCCVCLNVLSCFASQTRAFSNPIAPFFYVCVCVCFVLFFSLLLSFFELYFEFDRCCFQRRPQTKKQLVLAQIGNSFLYRRIIRILFLFYSFIFITRQIL